MKRGFLFLTIIYALGFLFSFRSLVVGLIVFAANRNLGHRDTFFDVPDNPIFLALTIAFALFGYGAFRCYRSTDAYAMIKWIVFLPIGLVLIYILWAIVILISAGGRWN